MTEPESPASRQGASTAENLDRPNGDQRKTVDALSHHELVDLATWLNAKAVVVRTALVTQGLELSLGSVGGESPRQVSIDVSQGQLVLETPLADLERAILLIVQERARAQGATIKSVHLKLKATKPRQLELSVTVAAKQGFFAATVEVHAQVTITDTFHARVSNVDVRGQGMLGGMVAMGLRPQIKQLEQDEYHISSLLPGNLRIQDVRVEVDQQLRLIATLAGSNIVLEKPPTGALPAHPSVPSVKPAAGQKGVPRKLDIFIIDTGWNEKAKLVLDSHLTLFEAFLAEQNVCILSATQSKTLIEQSPGLRGADPILMVVDSHRRASKADKHYGYRFCLGSLPQDAASTEAVARMLRIVAEGARGESTTTVERLTTEIQSEGLDGVMQVVVDVVEVAVERR